MLYHFRRLAFALVLLAAALPLTAKPVSEEVLQLPFADDASGTRSGVPDYELQTLKGQTLRLSSLRGRVVLLDFFLAACPHCRAHAPFISDLAKRYRDRGLTVVALCTNNPYTERELVERYAKDSNFDSDVVFVSLDVLMSFIKQRQDGSYGVPEAVLFGADGRFVARFTAWEEKDKPLVERAIAAELDKKK